MVWMIERSDLFFSVFITWYWWSIKRKRKQLCRKWTYDQFLDYKIMYFLSLFQLVSSNLLICCYRLTWETSPFFFSYIWVGFQTGLLLHIKCSNCASLNFNRMVAGLSYFFFVFDCDEFMSRLMTGVFLLVCIQVVRLYFYDYYVHNSVINPYI